MRSRMPRSAGSSSSAAQLGPQAGAGGVAQLRATASTPAPSRPFSSTFPAKPSATTHLELARTARRGPRSCRRSGARTPPSRRVRLDHLGCALGRLLADRQQPHARVARRPAPPRRRSRPSRRTGSRFSGRDSELAPASISTQGWPRAGSGTAIPGRCTPLHAADRQQRGGQHGAGRPGRDRAAPRGPRAPAGRRSPSTSPGLRADGGGRLVVEVDHVAARRRSRLGVGAMRGELALELVGAAARAARRRRRRAASSAPATISAGAAVAAHRIERDGDRRPSS